jgi:hypothetical protein
MNNELGLLVKDIAQDDLHLFIKNTKADTKVKKTIKRVEVDYSWVDVLNEAVPYLDTIIRNPRRFIVSEEDIIPIEKTKRVSEESIKHLAVHTNLIQDVDEDGLVKPLKLLNVFKEETIDLYENRFIYSLITNLYTFVNNQLGFKEQSLENKEEKSVSYEATTNFKGEDVSISLNLVSRINQESFESEDIVKVREDKINHIKEILEDFMASKFMKSMANATPVRSPIRKTNVILKEQNFIKALELWEYLERYQIEKPVKDYSNDENLTNKAFEQNYALTYYLNYGILNGLVSKNGDYKLPSEASLPKSVYDYAVDFKTDEADLKKEIDMAINKAANYKKEQKMYARDAYNNFINNHNARIKKACNLFK